MKNLRYYILPGLVLFFGIISTQIINAQVIDYTEYSGVVTDSNTNDPLISVSIKLTNSNLGSITNDEGAFIIKVPNDRGITAIEFSLLGYESKSIPLSRLSSGKNRIKLNLKVTELSQVNISSFRNAKALVKAVFDKKAQNNLNRASIMTAFYRETIKRRNRNVSLTEAVVNLYKEPYSSSVKDVVGLHKARKSTDYRRLDTVALKLQGGPFSTLYLDIMKYPEYIFTPVTMDEYEFSFGDPTTINNKPVYVVNFKQKAVINVPRYYGSFFIDAETLALRSASYSLKLTGMKDSANKMFVKKKPRDIDVTALSASYKVDYREKDGQWYYGYGSVNLSFKVKKRRKLFNSVYTLASEMAVTDWEENTTGVRLKGKDRLKPTVIMTDAVSGFKDPDFWGPYNVIEPEKSIESAIDKIQRKLRRNGST
ncbi:MAG: carboxypeptidase-like regulatory domain-containing protein [Bacteroidia bacterium]|nr:carboxypeptidase-like regulatory domain-containing protein [Bacteroidia bacterium]MBT8276961.1 carboxypeptidase-like regulatory domain-containing protein [Bacteroidia bacterium]NNJ81764.1 carboxypeptidase-like regulatory domain-containing protein [Flavobacteriaceae bacterium]NNK55308.1 carboxypeptidase-like regulatory domain-containing protein [Flavobacteriaceae bacterium]NNM09946.1 carboxypeptidase-like regulatory domain-containing protein [Flavobacteriaceae bacterium]